MPVSLSKRTVAALIVLAGLAGILIGTVVWAKPATYVSCAVIRVQGTRPMRDLETAALSRGALRTLILNESLYAQERARIPIEDAMARLKAAIRFKSLNSADRWRIEFVYPEPVKARAVLRHIVQALPDVSIEQDAAVDKPQTSYLQIA